MDGTPPSDPRPGTSPPPAARVAVVVNGNAQGVNAEVIGTLDRILSGGDLFVSHRLRDVADIARTIVERGYGTVLTGGGDGTFTVVASAVVREAERQGVEVPRIGLLRLGTGNALAWVLGASQAGRRGLSADVRRLLDDAGSRPLRLVEVEGLITPFCGFGADAIVLRDYQAVKGTLSRTPLRRVAPGAVSFLLGAATRTLPSYLVRPVPHCRVENLGADAHRVGANGRVLGPPIGAGEVLYEGPARVASVSTIEFSGFGFRYYPYAEEREDRMQLRVSTIGVGEFVQNLRRIWRGDYDNPVTVFDYLVERVGIRFDPPTPFQIGGDVLGDRSEVEIRLSPRAIRLVDFYAPPRAE
jgi:diacylglycerol kinase family enzyme